MPRSSTPSRGVAQMTTPNQRARMSQAPVATSTPESSSRHSSQNASGAARSASAATLGRIAASLRAAIAFSAEVSVSTIQSHADVASAPSTSSRQRPWSCRGKRSALATRAHGRAGARRYVTSRGAIRDNARAAGSGYSVVCDYGKGHALFAWTVTRSISDNAPLPLIVPRSYPGGEAPGSLGLSRSPQREPSTGTTLVACGLWTSASHLTCPEEIPTEIAHTEHPRVPNPAGPPTMAIEPGSVAWKATSGTTICGGCRAGVGSSKQ